MQVELHEVRLHAVVVSRLVTLCQCGLEDDTIHGRHVWQLDLYLHVVIVYSRAPADILSRRGLRAVPVEYVPREVVSVGTGCEYTSMT